MAVQASLHSLHDEIAKLVRQSTWLGLWFAVMAAPIDWAEKAVRWNAEAGEQIWDDQMLKVHRKHVACVTVLVVWSAQLFLVEAIGSSL